MRNPGVMRPAISRESISRSDWRTPKKQALRFGNATQGVTRIGFPLMAPGTIQERK